MNIAGYYEESISNGIGWRFVLFVSGCIHKCDECYNPETWNKKYGILFDKQFYLNIIKNNTLITGVTISGGEPFLYPEELNDFILEVKKINLNIWVYTGYIYEDLLQKDKNILNMINNIEVIVDGKYNKNLKYPTKKFRGSNNQRIIDVQNSLKLNQTILLNI
jgi:anaerobic ribonucleoside-triphosphate reductase activating protein